MRQIAEKIAELSEREIGDPNIKEFKPDKLDENRFHEIPSTHTSRKIACIDGGNQELLTTPEFSAQLNRVYFNIFKEKKRVPIESNIPQRIEFLSLTTTKWGKNKVYFETSISPIDDKFKKFLPNETKLTSSEIDEKVSATSKEGMERVASKARRCTEWIIAKRLLDMELDSGDIIIRDGSLQVSHSQENEYVNKLFNKAIDDGVILTGLSKSCRLTTTTQLSIIAAIQRLSRGTKFKSSKWVYYPIAEMKRSEPKPLMMVVNLNKFAYSPFRFEMLNKQADELGRNNILDVISSISNQSNDLSLPGYPYGLFDADRWARVTNEEIESYRTRFYSEISKTVKWDDLKYHIRAIDLHDKLDSS